MIGVKNIWEKHVPVWHSPSQSSPWFVAAAIVTPGVTTPVTLGIFPLHIWQEEPGGKHSHKLSLEPLTHSLLCSQRTLVQPKL